MPESMRRAAMDAAEAFLETGPWTAPGAEAHAAAVRECASDPELRRRVLIALGRLAGLLRETDAAKDYVLIALNEFPADREIQFFADRLNGQGSRPFPPQAPPTRSRALEDVASSKTPPEPEAPTSDRFTAFVAADSERFAKHIVSLLSDLPNGTIKPRVSAYLGRWRFPIAHLKAMDVFLVLKNVAVFCVVVFAVVVVGFFAPVPGLNQALQSLLAGAAGGFIALLLLGGPLLLTLILIRGLYIVVLAARTSVEIVAGKIRLETGVFTRVVHNIEVTKLRDITLEQSFFNQLTGDGALVCLADGLSLDRGKGDRIELVGLVGGYERLRALQDKLRDLKFMMRSANYEKGIIQ